EELFNLQHTQACNMIEWILSILKKQFTILETPIEYDFPVQVKVVLALTVLHNLLKEETDRTKYRQQLEQILEDKKRQEIQTASGDHLSTGNLEDNNDKTDLKDTGSVDMRKL
ncbi:hypothetical protein L873DRAFT_1714032, partial [Choiromyces venosus 120613-1]